VCDSPAMGARMRDTMARVRDELRYEPTEKRIRATFGDQPVVDSTRAALVWEPRRVVPSYAVPVEDVRAEILPGPPAQAPPAHAPILHPGIPFAAHSCAGEPVSLRAAGEARDGVAFRFADADLDGYLELDFYGFDAWYEEDERIVSHPRDPFHRVDARRSTRHVRIELDGELLAETSRPTLVFETGLPVRFYLPREDLRAQPEPSERRTYCPYKGEASYSSFDVNGRRRRDLAWSYEQPLPDAAELRGLIAFWNERVDMVVDGERTEKPATVFTAALAEEAGP
jgi:uncharacterized protein (DUF427 family)